MATASPIVKMLAQRSVEELEGMRDSAEQVMAEARRDLDLIERALVSKRPQRKRRVSKRGDTRRRILDFMASRTEPVGPAEVRDALIADGIDVGSSAVYNQVARLLSDGIIRKVDEGLYELASGNGSPGGARNEGTERLSLATDPQEGRND